MDINQLNIFTYIRLQGCNNYVRVSDYIGVSQLRYLTMKSRLKHINSIKVKVNRYGSIVLDLDTELHYTGLNIFKTVITDLLGMGNIIVLVHTVDMYRRLLLYSRLNNVKLKVYLINKKRIDNYIINSNGIELSGNRLTLNLKDRVSMVTSDKTVLSIIRDLSVYKGINDIVINIDGVTIVDLYKFYRLLRDEFKSSLSIVSSDNAILEELKLVYAYYNTKTKSSVELLKDILMSIELNTVVLLYTYDLGRGDIYKRRGDGVIANVKIAIFKGINKTGNLFFDTYTRSGLESGNYKVVRESISINLIGFMDSFIGTQYHIELPILNNLNDVGNYSISGEQVLCADYIEYLLNKNNIEYNKQALHSCVEISYNNLKDLVKQ